MESGFLKTTFQTFMCLFIMRKVDQRKTLSCQRKICLSFKKKCFPFILDEKQISEVVKNSETSCYLLIISNLILNLLIAIYFVLNLALIPCQYNEKTRIPSELLFIEKLHSVSSVFCFLYVSVFLYIESN
jgi:hypothetical protein